MIDVLDYAPIAATAFAVPEFLPQILKLRATHDTAGVSWSWATLTSINNAAWIAYFALEGYRVALIPSSSAVLLVGTLAVMLTIRGRAARRPLVLISGWAAMLITAYGVAGPTGLGTLLTAAFIVQVAPSLWTAYRTARPTGLSSGTWMLVLGELSCWMIFGLYKSDPRLITLGVTGVAASALMLVRIYRTGREPASRAPTCDLTAAGSCGAPTCEVTAAGYCGLTSAVARSASLPATSSPAASRKAPQARLSACATSGATTAINTVTRT
jgi:uncharacterized protein with PQ loop repeat